MEPKACGNGASSTAAASKSAPSPMIAPTENSHCKIIWVDQTRQVTQRSFMGGANANASLGWHPDNALELAGARTRLPLAGRLGGNPAP